MGNRFSRAFGRVLLRLSGWQVRGHFPAEKRLMIIGAPHTSNWDFVVACFGILALGLRVSVMMKKEAFFWPCKRLFTHLGFIPIDRQQAQSVVAQMATWYEQHEQCWIGITPEGTRAKVDNWKSGFLRIAYQAGVPVLMVGLDFPSKSIVLVPELFYPSGDHDADLTIIRAFYADNFVGKNADRQ